VVFEGECAQKQPPARIRRFETKYWAVHFKRHCRNSSPGCIKHEEKSEGMHRWTRWTFPALNITLFLFSDFSVIYFLTNRSYVRNGLHDFSITLHRWMGEWLYMMTWKG
jgi:hypothetical protein